MKNVRLDSPQEDRQPRAGHLPAGGGVARDADEQFHRHDRRRTRADRRLVQGGRAHARPAGGNGLPLPFCARPSNPSSLASMPTYDATLPYPATWPATANPPHARWPGGARIAVQFVLNYEEGGAPVLHGDPAPSSSCPRCSIRPATRTATCPWRASTSMARAPASGASCASSSGRLPLTVFGGHGLQRHPELASGLRRAGPRDRLPRLALGALPGRGRGHRARTHVPGHAGHRAADRRAPAGLVHRPRQPAHAGWWPTTAASSTTATTTATTCPSGCRCAGATARSCRS